MATVDEVVLTIRCCHDCFLAKVGFIHLLVVAGIAHPQLVDLSMLPLYSEFLVQSPQHL